MADLEALEREIRLSPAGETLKEAAQSPEGQRVLRSLDKAKVSEAARNGDMQALKNILSGVLSTPEGQELAKRILTEVEKIAKENDGKTVVIATHATPVRSMECAWRGMTFDEMKDIPWVTNASVTEADYENGKFTLNFAGKDDHLSDIATSLPKNV